MSSIKSITNEVIVPGRRANRSWFAPAVAAAPGWGKDGSPEILVCAQYLTGCDIGPGFWMRTSDLGANWTPPYLSQTLIGSTVADDPKIRKYLDGPQSMFDSETGVVDESLVYVHPGVGPYYHRATDTILGLGGTYCTRDRGENGSQKHEEHVRGYLRDSVSAVWDRKKGDFKPWKRIPHPTWLSDDHYMSFVGISQWVEADDGTIYMPAATGTPGTPDAPAYPGTTVVRCEYDGEDFRFVEQGAVVEVAEPRGLAESSLTKFQGRYYLTMRNDVSGYVAAGDDPMAMGEIRQWTMDDGENLGNYNTMQHWLARDDGLYLIYNRRHELNNGVVRSRAPLFIAQVDPDNLCVIRDTEQVLIGENGARLGNFTVVNVSDDESWVVCGEWLQQYIPDHAEGMPFWVNGMNEWNNAPGESPYNRTQYIGDLLLARVKFA